MSTVAMNEQDTVDTESDSTLYWYIYGRRYHVINIYPLQGKTYNLALLTCWHTKIWTPVAVTFWRVNGATATGMN